jgi:tRNA (guanine10-N2)-methyltransferase
LLLSWLSLSRKNRIAQCIAYPVPDILRDLLAFAAKMLVKGGRLIYWLPTTDKYQESDIPQHPCLKIVANSEQPITLRWRRRLITMEKIVDFDNSLHQNYSPANDQNPAHKNFSSYILKRQENPDK